MTNNYEQANELRARMVTGPDLWKPAPKVEISVDIETVKFIGKSLSLREHLSYEIREAIWEACREWCEENEQ